MLCGPKLRYPVMLCKEKKILTLAARTEGFEGKSETHIEGSTTTTKLVVVTSSGNVKDRPGTASRIVLNRGLHKSQTSITMNMIYVSAF